MKTQLPATAEFGSAIFKANHSARQILDTKPRAMIGGKTHPVSLYYQPAGYVPAGSCARLQSFDVWGYTWHDGTASHGRMFRSLSEAQTHFDAIAK